MNRQCEAISRVIESRLKNGATRESVILWLEHLRADVWKSDGMHKFLDRKINELREVKP
jgi:hypothetical protein